MMQWRCVSPAGHQGVLRSPPIIANPIHARAMAGRHIHPSRDGCSGSVHLQPAAAHEHLQQHTCTCSVHLRRAAAHVHLDAFSSMPQAGRLRQSKLQTSMVTAAQAHLMACIRVSREKLRSPTGSTMFWM